MSLYGNGGPESAHMGIFGDRFLIRHFGCLAKSACWRTVSLDDEINFVEAIAITVSYHDGLKYCIWDARLKVNTALTPWLPLPEDFEGRKLVWERFMNTTTSRSLARQVADRRLESLPALVEHADADVAASAQ